MSKLPHITIIVLNWNGRSLLDTCLTGLSNLDYPYYTMLLVDNDSTDDSVDFVRHRFPHVNILQNEGNLGYARGNNRALRALNSDYALLVNPDIVVRPDWLSQLILPMIADESIGISGCKLVYPEGRLLQHAGGQISHPQAMPVHRGVFEADVGQFDELCDMDYVTGAAIAIRRATLQSIGYLDEGFFMYFEEADYCARARASGYRVVYNPGATAVHDESAIAVRGSLSYLQRFHTGRWRYLLKHFDINEILTSTFPVEEHWLAGRQGAERRALKGAYRKSCSGLDQILTARVADGGSEVDSDQRKQLVTGLFRLRKMALDWSEDEARLEELGVKAHLQERPFTSPTPLVGPLLSRLRALWARVAVREQVSTFTNQQNKINEMLVQELREMESRLQRKTAVWLENEEELATLKGHQVEMKTELARSYQLLASIEARLKRLEKHEGGNDSESAKDQV